MKKNFANIPINSSSKNNLRYLRHIRKNKMKNPLTNHSSFDIHNKSYNKINNNPINKIQKNTKECLVLKGEDFYPSLKNQDLVKDYFKISTDIKGRITETDCSQDYSKNKAYKRTISRENVFNGQSNKYVIKNIYDNINNIEKRKDNCCYYESKYTRLVNEEKENHCINGKIKENFVNYPNENKNISNLQSDKSSKHIIFDYHVSKRNEIYNPLKKYESESNYSKDKIAKSQTLINSNNNSINKRIAILKNENNIKTTKAIINSINNNSSKSIQLETLSDIYRSPEKKFKKENSFQNNNKIENNASSKSFDKNNSNTKIEVSQRKNHNNNNISKNKKISLTKEQKLNIKELNKQTKLALKKIPFSSKPKINIININSLTKNNSSYTTATKLNDKQGNNSSQKDLNEKIKSNSIKGINLINFENFQKSISTKYNNKKNSQTIDKDNSINNISQTKSNTIHIIGSKLINGDNQNKSINTSYSSRFEPITISNSSINKKPSLILSRLKKGKIDNINKDVILKRLNSQQNFTNSKLMKGEIPKSNIIPRIIDQSQRYTGDSNTDIKYHYSNIKNPNTPITSIKLITKFNNSSEIKKDLSKNSNYIQKITISKANLQENNNNSSLKKNNNKGNLLKVLETPNQKQKNKRYLSDCNKHESRPIAHISSNNRNNEDKCEEDWDDNEYMGMRKKTFDPGKGAGKNKSRTNINNLIKNNFITSELFSEKTFIKSCESITVAGKKENGHKKINQDSYIIERNINGILDFNIFGVLDGHGEDGHYASQFVTRYVISNIKNHPLLKKCEQAKEIYQKIIFNGYQIIANIFTQADIEIQKEKFNCKNSGTTCVIVIQLEEKIICANTGDSRAILIYDDNIYDNNLNNSKICPLSYDCKPELPNERKRIYECGGTVERALDDNDEEGGPYRVWAFGENYPGLAMSRSIGDMDAKKIGVIPNPQIVEYTINNDSKYMLICSDGVWEFISNEEAMKIGNKYYLKNDAIGLCQELYKKSVDYWMKEDECIDDITAIAVFF